jgi:hypothetical protein
MLLLLLLLQAALKQLSQRHPYIMPYMDAGVYAYINAQPLKKALLVVKALEEKGEATFFGQSRARVVCLYSEGLWLVREAVEGVCDVEGGCVCW